jgi:RNA polymerase sigma-70 factor (ECF subfamily)
VNSLQKLDDVAVVQQALQGSQPAYTEIVRRYERPVFTLIVRMVRDRTVAEDLAQDAFLKAFGALERFDCQRKLSSWLFKIAHNTTLDHLRRKVPDTVTLEGRGDDSDGLSAVLEDESVEAPDRRAERWDLSRDLSRALERVRSDYREILVLRYQEELSYNEIADITGLPLGTVKTHLHRGRKQMAVALNELGYAKPPA